MSGFHLLIFCWAVCVSCAMQFVPYTPMEDLQGQNANITEYHPLVVCIDKCTRDSLCPGFAVHEDNDGQCYPSTTEENLPQGKWKAHRKKEIALIDGPEHSIPHGALTASSDYGYQYHPECSRMYNRAPTCDANCWLARDANNAYIQADLGRKFVITIVGLHGRGYGDQYVKSFKMAVFDHSNVKFYNLKNGEPKVFEGNTNDNTWVKNRIEPPMYGRFIRLYPLTVNYHGSMQWELYGINQ